MDNYKSNDRKFVQNQACMQEHLFKHFNSNGHDGFLKNVSIILIDKTDGKDPKKREYTGRERSKHMHHLDLILRTVSDQSRGLL